MSMPIQEIITYAIVAIALAIGLISLLRSVFPSGNKSNSTGCSSGCNCDAKVLRKELLQNRKPAADAHPNQG